MVDQLAKEYAAAGKPVVFLEQNKQYTTWLGLSVRLNRFFAASVGKSGYPAVLVEGGHQWTYGPKNSYYNSYKAMVEAELARAAKAEISATAWRVGNHLEFDVRMKNLSGVTLSANNEATVFVIVYEDITKDLTKGDTTRIDRDVVYTGITTPLKNTAGAAFSLKTKDLLNVNWAKLHSVAFVDYRPAGNRGPYDILQAAFAGKTSFAVQPNSFTFQVDPDHPADPQATLRFTGAPASLVWSVTSKPTWVTVTPASGVLGASAVMKVDASALQPGSNSGVIRFSASATGLTLTQNVSVQVYYTPPARLIVEPNAINLIVDPDAQDDPRVTLKVSGFPAALAWTVTSKPAWVTVTPASGVLGAQPVARIDASALHLGANTGTIRFSAFDSGTLLTTDVPVRVVYNDVVSYFLPLIGR